ncbi:class I SAM-dependent methyltransferase [Demequina sp.]|uniref:class I SAM-dependent methyltransferase n=1 Tax=Demequina sp. TaxID=2050685 RepID=UPI0025ED7473|nr:class I SAM-dependent methyltransferase [Demequina sp.]
MGVTADASSLTAVRPEKLEILDVLWANGPDGARLPVRRDDAVERLRASDQPGAAALVQAMPAHGGVLDEDAVDATFLAVHLELARLSEFVHVPQRMAQSLRPVVDRLRDSGEGPVRIVDLGCGIGYDTRILAATGALGDGVEYVGLDFNSLLVDAATRLAALEEIPVTFLVGDALDSSLSMEDPDRTVVVSSGVLHHLGRDNLQPFFAQTANSGVAAFAHFDVNPGLWADVGAWVLHHTRMREPVSRHDGSMSMKRAFTTEDLLTYASAGCGRAYHLRCDKVTNLYPRPEQIVRPVLGLRRDLGGAP